MFVGCTQVAPPQEPSGPTWVESEELCRHGRAPVFACVLVADKDKSAGMPLTFKPRMWDVENVFRWTEYVPTSEGECG